jgi:magnesium transporter
VCLGLWGMNVKVPGQDEDSLYWFAGLVVLLFSLAMGTFCVIRRMKLV